MNADEAQLWRHLLRHKTREMFPLARPWKQPDCDQSLAIMQADGGAHAANPFDWDFLARAPARIERDELQEIITAKQITRSPLARRALFAGRQRLINQVIAKDRRTRGTNSSDILPEVRLGRPAIWLVQHHTISAHRRVDTIRGR